MTRSQAIGALRHRLVLEAPERVDDGGGGVTLTWVQVATLWGAIKPLSGLEVFAGDRLTGRLTHEIRIRYRSGVTADMRFRQDTRVFQIVASVDIEERHRWLRCLCEERDL